MRHRCVIGVCSLSILLLLFICLPLSAQDKVRIGLSSVSATSGSIWAAEEKGLFKKHGIDAEVIIIGDGAARVGADPKEFLDESLVREVEASGFIKGLYDKN